MKDSNKIVKLQKKGLKGTIEIPPDKSISHRAAIFAAMTHDKTPVDIYNFSSGKDCHSTLGVLRDLGVKIEFKNEKNLQITSPEKFTKPKNPLEAGNSGTTIRLMAGVLACQDFDCIITGDESLKKRPMKRIIEPLEQMGAKIDSNESKAPLYIKGKQLKGIEYSSSLASAQVKSCILLAGLNAEEKTTVVEPYLSRNHTELLLEYLGAKITTERTKSTVKKSKLQPKKIHIPGDISSAAFFIAAGLIVPDSEITLTNVGLNETRTGIIEVLKIMGANIEILNETTICGEKKGDIKVKTSQLKGTTIEGEIIPKLIDEIPILAVIATQAKGQTTIKDAQDLRNKECDRIKAMAKELRKLGVKVTETKDGMIIKGKKTNKPNILQGGTKIDTYHDHRIAMSMYIAGLLCKDPIEIQEFNWVEISFPEFEDLIKSLA